MLRAVLSASLLALAASAAPAAAATLGMAGNYNEFIIGDSNRQYTDIQGKVAVGGNLTLNGLSVADLMPTNQTNVVVGGNLTAQNGTIRGNTVVGGNVNYTNPTINGNIAAGGSVTFAPNSGGSVNGTVTYGTTFTKPGWMNPSASQGTTTVPINFSQEALYLKALSQAQVKASDPTAIYQWSQLFFNAGSAPLNVFNVTEAMFENATGGFNINAAAGSTVVINVPGLDVNVLNTGFTLTGGITVDRVLWNFYEATKITLQGSAVGTFLAPNAAVLSNWGGFNGNLIAAALHGYGGPGVGSGLETHTKLYGGGAPTLFTGTLRDIPTPPPASVPEPGMLGLLGGALALVALRRRVR